MQEVLSEGQVRSGQLIDGAAETPFQSCTLTYERRQGPHLSVPYVLGEAQFAAVEQWFEQQQPPPSLIFSDNKGTVTLTGLRWLGHGGLNLKLGRLGADVAIYGQPRQLKFEYKLQKVQSRIDGLHEFARFRSIKEDDGPRGQNGRITVTVEAKEKLVWRHGGFTFTIRASAPWTITSGENFTARAGAVLETSKYRGATMNEHITAQWPIRALLILTHGQKLFWREHHVLDKQFPTWMLSGLARDPEYLPTQFRRTLRDAEEPEPLEPIGPFSMFRLSDVGTRGLRKWIELYQDPIIRRAIEPVVEVINGASAFLEPQLMMTVLGLEAMGHYRDPKRARNVALFKQIERCLAAADVDLSAIGPVTGIAKAIANANNNVKHPDRPNRPDSVELRLMVDLATIISRLQLFDLLSLPEKLKASFIRSRDVHRAIGAFDLNRVSVNADGSLTR